MAHTFSAKDAVILKRDRDKPLWNKHPWVFMGAVESYPDFENGDFLPVLSSRGDFFGYGYFHAGQSIVGRMFSFREGDPTKLFIENIHNAITLRKQIIPANTSAYRLINGEGDNLPGLIVDVYGDVLVLQINTLGIEKQKTTIIDILKKEIKPKAIYEKSATQTRRKEGLEDISEWIFGEPVDEITITEHGLTFAVQFADAQKTGFFLDQREMRKLVQNYAKDKTLLNCFSYTGGFSIYALAGGAKHVDSIDSDAHAIELAKKNVTVNKLDESKAGFFAEDVFGFLAQKQLPQNYDFIILDPPAFAKRKNDITNASRGYHDLTRLALEKLPKGGLLLTSSCSAHIDKDLFQTIVFQAAKDAKRDIRILSYHALAADHPVNLFYPEGDYLKSLLLYVE
jgi:23S rRNA (cytosine1962-C5)-methyltransferase